MLDAGVSPKLCESRQVFRIQMREDDGEREREGGIAIETTNGNSFGRGESTGSASDSRENN